MKELLKLYRNYKESRVCICQDGLKDDVMFLHSNDCPFGAHMKTDIGEFLEWLDKNTPV